MTTTRVRPTQAATVLALTVGLLLMAACGGEAQSEKRVCGLIERTLVSDVLEGRDWTQVGTLYRDGRTRDGCTVLVHGEQAIVITLTGFRDSGEARRAILQGLKEHAGSEEKCADPVKEPVTKDRVTAGCDDGKEIHYAVWNPRRLVRMTLDHSHGVSMTTKDAVRLVAGINRGADALEPKAG